jgi:hypothetical protein
LTPKEEDGVNRTIGAATRAGGVKRMAQKTISIHPAPVLILWGAVVAQRLGFNEDEALTLGKALAGLNTKWTGRRLGIFKPHEGETKKVREKRWDERFAIEICGRPVPAKNTDKGIRAVRGLQAIDPDSVRLYLKSNFNEALDAVRSAMENLAQTFSPQELAEKSYPLYEQFRPKIPVGVKRWGAKGELDLGLIEGLGKDKT